MLAICIIMNEDLPVETEKKGKNITNKMNMETTPAVLLELKKVDARIASDIVDNEKRKNAKN